MPSRSLSRLKAKARGGSPSGPSLPEVQPSTRDPYTGLQAADTLSNLQSSAQSALTIPNLDPNDREQVASIAQGNFAPQVGGIKGGLANIFSWLDRPRTVVSLGVADVLGLDSRAGQEVGIADYKAALRGDREALVEQLGSSLVGDEGFVSGSTLLSLVTGERNDEPDRGFWQKTIHALSGFGADVLLDPLTYVTGGLSGVGRKTSLTAARSSVEGAGNRAARTLFRGSERIAAEGAEAALTPLERGMRQAITDKAATFYDDMLRDYVAAHGDDAANDLLALDDLWDEAVRKAAGMSDNTVVSGTGVIGEYVDDISQVIATKDFGARNVSNRVAGRWDQYVAQAQQLRDGQRLAEPFTTGGLRFTNNPFNPRAAVQVQVPGTRGLVGRVTQPVKAKFPAFAPFDYIKRALPHFDADAALLKAAKEGRVSDVVGTQFLARQVVTDLDIEGHVSRIASAASAVDSAARKAGLANAEVEELFGKATKSLALGSVSDDVLTSGLSDDVLKAFERYVGTASETYRTMWQKLQQVVPSLGRIDDYTPIAVTPEFRDIVKQLAADARLPTISNKSAQALGVDPGELATFGEIVSALVPSVRRSIAPGSATEFGRRTLGAGIFDADALSIAALADGVGVDIGGNKFQDPAELSAAITNVLDAVLEANGDRALAKVRDKMRNALELDPLRSQMVYLGDVQRAAYERSLYYAALDRGLIRNAPTAVKANAVVASLQPTFREVVDAASEVVQNGAAAIDRIAARDVPTRTFRIGGLDVDIPKIVADRPEVVRSMERLRSTMKDVARVKREVRKAQTVKAKELQRTLQLSEEAANLFAMMDTPERLAEAQVLARAELQVYADEVQEAAMEALRATGATASELAEAAGKARAARQRIVRQGNDQIDQLRTKFNETYRAPKVQINEQSLTAYNPDGTINREITDARIAYLAEQMRKGVETDTRHMRAWHERMADEAAEIVEGAGGGPNGRGLSSDNPIVKQAQARMQGHEAAVRMFDAATTADDKLGLIYQTVVAQSNAEHHDAIMREWGRMFQEVVADLDPLLPYVQEMRQKLERMASRADIYSSDFRDPAIYDFLARSDPNYIPLVDIHNPGTAAWDEVSKVEARKGGTLLGGRAGEIEEQVLAARRELGRLKSIFPTIEQGSWMGGWSGIGPIDQAAQVIASQRPIAALASLPYDPSLMETVRNHVGVLERIMKKHLGLDGNLVLHPTKDGNGVHIAMVFNREVEASAVPSLDEIAAALDGNQEIARFAGASIGVHDAPAIAAGQALLDIKKRMTLARSKARVFGSTARKTAKQYDAALESWEKIAKPLYQSQAGVRGGVARLRNVAFDRTATGAAKPSAALKTLLDTLEPHDARFVTRALESAMLLDKNVLGIDRAWMRRNFQMYSGVMDRPVTESISTMYGTIDKLYERAAARQSAEVAQQVDLAQQFMRRWSGLLDDYVPNDPNGRTILDVLTDETAAVKFKERTRELERAAKFLDDKSLYHGKLSAKKVKKAVSEARAANTIQTTTEGFASPAVFGLEGGAFQGKVIDPLVGQVFEDLVNNMRLIHTPWALEQIGRSGREALRWWKSAATVSRPSFHFRNLIGGVSNGFLAGVGPHHYARIAPDLTRWRVAMSRFGRDDAFQTMDDVFNYLSKKNQATFRAAWEEGVFQTGFARGDVLSGAQARLAQASINPLSPDNVMFRAGGEIMENFEDFMRVAAFSAWYDPKNPATAELARDMVMLVHFDYQHLTNLERNMKKVAPFFVWTRRNVPLQLRSLMERPGTVNAYNHLRSNIQDSQASTSADAFPLNPFTSSLAIATDVMWDENTPHWARMILDPDLPLQALDDLPLFEGAGAISPLEWFNWGTELLGPQISLPFELRESSEFGSANAPAGLNEILELMDTYTPIDLPVSRDGDVQVNRWISRAFYTALPFVDEYRRLIGLAPNEPDRAAREGFTQDAGYNLGDRFLRSLFSTTARGLTGSKFQVPADTKSAAYTMSEWLREVKDNAALGID